MPHVKLVVVSQARARHYHHFWWNIGCFLCELIFCRKIVLLWSPCGRAVRRITEVWVALLTFRSAVIAALHSWQHCCKVTAQPTFFRSCNTNKEHAPRGFLIKIPRIIIASSQSCSCADRAACAAADAIARRTSQDAHGQHSGRMHVLAVSFHFLQPLVLSKVLRAFAADTACARSLTTHAMIDPRLSELFASGTRRSATHTAPR